MAADLEIVIKGKDAGASKALDDVGDGMDRLERRSSGLLSRGLNPLKDMMMGGLKAAAVGVAAAIGGLAAGLGSSISAAADMEQQLADISASMNTSSEETASLKNLISDLGMDPKLKVSATEAADAIQTLGTAGLSVDQILGGAAKATVLLSNATGADFADAAAAATDVMSLWGIEAKDLTKVVNGITGVTLESKFGFNDYALALGTGAKGAVAAKISFDQFNQMLTATSGNFTSGMTAGTGLTAMMLGLAPSTDKASNLMKELGIITADGRNQFFDHTGAVRSNAEISNVLRDTLGKLSTEQRLLAVDTLFGRDAMAAVNGMIATTDDSWRKYSDALAKTDAEQQAATRMATLKGALEILGGVFEGLKIQVGDKFVPVITQMVNKFTEFLQTNAPAIVKWAENLATGLSGLVDKYLPVLVNQWIPKLVQQAGTWWQIGKEVVAVTWSMGQAVYGALQEIIGWVRGTQTEFTNLRYIWDSAKTTALTLFGNLMTYVQSNLPTWLGKLGEWGAAAWRWIVDALPVALTKLGEWGGALLLWLGAKLPEWGAKLGQWGMALLGWIQPMIGPALMKLGEWSTALLGWIGANLPTWLGKLAEWGAALLGWIGPMIVPALGKLAEWKGSIQQWLIDRIPDFIATMLRWATVLVGWIGDALPTAIDKLTSFIGGVNTWGNNDGKTKLGETTIGWATRLLEWVNTELLPKVKPELIKLVDKVKEASPEIERSLTELGKTLGAALLRGLWDAITPDSTKGMLDSKIKNPFEEWGIQARMWTFEKGKELMGRLSEGMSTMDTSGITNGVARAKESFNTGMEAFKTHAYTVASTIGTRINDGLKAIPPASTIAQNIDDMIDKFNTRMDGFKTHVSSVIGGLGEGIRGMFGGMNLGGGMYSALNGIIDAFNAVMDSFKIHVLGVMKDIGGRIGNGLAEGVRNSIGAVNDALRWITDAAPQWIKDQLGIHSPSRVFMEIGSNIMAGLAQGIEQMVAQPQLALVGATDGLLGAGAQTTINNSRTTQTTNNFTLAGQASSNDSFETVRILNTLYGQA